MAKLNNDDHKSMDIAAKALRWLLGAAIAAGSFIVGSKIKDNIGDDDENEDEEMV